MLPHISCLLSLKRKVAVYKRQDLWVVSLLTLETDTISGCVLTGEGGGLIGRSAQVKD